MVTFYSQFDGGDGSDPTDPSTNVQWTGYNHSATGCSMLNKNSASLYGASGLLITNVANSGTMNIYKSLSISANASVGFWIKPIGGLNGRAFNITAMSSGGQGGTIYAYIKAANLSIANACSVAIYQLDGTVGNTQLITSLQLAYGTWFWVTVWWTWNASTGMASNYSITPYGGSATTGSTSQAAYGVPAMDTLWVGRNATGTVNSATFYMDDYCFDLSYGAVTPPGHAATGGPFPFFLQNQMGGLNV